MNNDDLINILLKVLIEKINLNNININIKINYSSRQCIELIINDIKCEKFDIYDRSINDIYNNILLSICK